MSITSDNNSSNDNKEEQILINILKMNKSYTKEKLMFLYFNELDNQEFESNYSEEQFVEHIDLLMEKGMITSIQKKEKTIYMYNSNQSQETKFVSKDSKTSEIVMNWSCSIQSQNYDKLFTSISDKIEILIRNNGYKILSFDSDFKENIIRIECTTTNENVFVMAKIERFNLLIRSYVKLTEIPHFGYKFFSITMNTVRELNQIPCNDKLLILSTNMSANLIIFNLFSNIIREYDKGNLIIEYIEYEPN